MSEFFNLIKIILLEIFLICLKYILSFLIKYNDASVYIRLNNYKLTIFLYYLINKFFKEY